MECRAAVPAPGNLVFGNLVCTAVSTEDESRGVGLSRICFARGLLPPKRAGGCRACGGADGACARFLADLFPATYRRSSDPELQRATTRPAAAAVSARGLHEGTGLPHFEVCVTASVGSLSATPSRVAVSSEFLPHLSWLDKRADDPSATSRTR